MPGLDSIEHIEDLGIKAAQLSGLDHIPGVDWVVDRHLRERRLRDQQRRLEPFAGRLVVVAGNLSDYQTRIEPDRLAERTSKTLFEDDIIGHDKPVAIRTLIPDELKTDETVEHGAYLIRTAVQSNYDISPYFIPEPQPIDTLGRSSDPNAEPIYQAIDTAIIDLNTRMAATRGATPLRGHSRLVLMLVMRDSLAGDVLPPPINPGNMEMGRTALLAEVGETHQENTWLPDLLA